MTTLTVEQLVALVGVILSILFNYLPGAADWYAGQTETYKKLFMLLLLVLTTLGFFGASCAGILTQLYPGLLVSCDKPGLLGLIWVLIQAVIANQATYKISPTLERIQAIKDNRVSVN